MKIQREITIIIVLFLFIVILVSAIDFYKRTVEQADARNFIKEDLLSKYPGSDVEIIEAKEKQNDKGEKYFEIKSKVTQDPNSACPQRKHIYYNYPEQNFVPQPEEKITQNCNVCLVKPCILAFPEEAIIASHTFKGTEEVAKYLLVYPTAAPTVSEEGDSWVVVWNSPLAGEVYEIKLTKSGTVISVKGGHKAL